MGSGLGGGTPFYPSYRNNKNIKDLFMNIEIPNLPLEEMEPEIKDSDIIKDESGGSLAYAFIGIGQAGGRLVKAFYDLGYKKALAINTAQHDLKLLELPDEQKYYIDYLGENGAGKDQELGSKALQSREQEIFDKMRKVFGDKVDRIVLCIGTAGGTGGGGVIPMIKVAKEYFSYVGKYDASERVGVIAALPTIGELASPQVAKNAFERTTELCNMASKGDFAPLIIIDNGKIKKLYPKLTVTQFWPFINNTVAGLFHVFNILAAQDSNITTFDPTDYDSVMKAPGCMIMGVTSVTDIEEETSVSGAIKSNLEKTLLAEGFDLKTAKAAAAIVVGNSDMFSSIPGLMDTIEHGFSALAALTGEAVVHRGIYEGNKTKLTVYTIIGGLAAPRERLEDLKRFLKVKAS